MYRVLLADDENTIVEGLAVIIDWQGMGCEIVGLAYNGEQLIQLALEEDPDIIITDIRMPHCDGLEAIQSLRQHGISVKIIVMSGYSEFEYAKKAMELDVKHYVLKPLEEEELLSSVHTVLSELKTEHQLQDERNAFRTERILQELSQVKLSETEALTLLQDLGIHDSMCQFVGVLVHRSGPPNSPASAWTSFVQQQPQLARTKGINMYPFPGIDHELGLLLTVHPSLSEADVEEAMHHLRHGLEERTNITVTISFGSLVAAPHLLQQSFSEARYALGYRLIHGRDTVIGPDLVHGDEEEDPLLFIEETEAISEAVDTLNETLLQESIKRLYDRLLHDTRVRPIHLQVQSLQIILTVMQGMTQGQIELLNHQHGFNLLSMDEISRFSNIASLQSHVIAMCTAAISLRRKYLISQQKDITEEIKKYIRTNYAEPITLVTAAETFYLNPNYISQLFKKKTGKTFLDYLTHVRISKAKELLLSTELMVYEICISVGYRDTKHFSRIFEKSVGCKPSKYKLGLKK